jgi:hypothetical protein
VFVVAIAENMKPLSSELSCTVYKTRSWMPWRGCSMNVFLLGIEENDDINMKILVMKILVSCMVLMSISEVVVMTVVVVVGVLIRFSLDVFLLLHKLSVV